jgi:hypothetical protein
MFSACFYFIRALHLTGSRGHPRRPENCGRSISAALLIPIIPSHELAGIHCLMDNALPTIQIFLHCYLWIESLPSPSGSGEKKILCFPYFPSFANVVHVAFFW